MRYKVSIRKTDEGYAAWCPGLPGCWSQGETEEQALENIRDAIEAYLETVQELTHDKECRPIPSMPSQWLELSKMLVSARRISRSFCERELSLNPHRTRPWQIPIP